MSNIVPFPRPVKIPERIGSFRSIGPIAESVIRQMEKNRVEKTQRTSDSKNEKG